MKLRWLSGCVAALVVGLAGMLKFSDLPAFSAALDTWQSIPSVTKPILIVVVPCVEASLAIAWTCGGAWARRSLQGIALLLALWTLGYVIETMVWSAPSCGCFGKLQQWYLLRNAWPWVVGRNCAIAACAYVGATKSPAPSARRAVVFDAIARDARSAFTLIETILVIVLVALLGALMVPSLSHARLKARSLLALSDLRSHVSVAAAYAVDYKDVLPLVADPAYTHTILQTPDGRVVMPYFGQRHMWYFGMADQYYEGNYWNTSFFAPKRRGSGRGEPYWYAMGCVARPEFWNLLTRTKLGQFGPVRISEVLYPAKKGLFINWREAFESVTNLDRLRFQNAQPETGFADGSARVVPYDTFRDPVRGGEGLLTWPYTEMNWGVPVVHTVDGVRGRDVP